MVSVGLSDTGRLFDEGFEARRLLYTIYLPVSNHRVPSPPTTTLRIVRTSIPNSSQHAIEQRRSRPGLPAMVTG